MSDGAVVGDFGLRVAAERLSGKRPSPPRAAAAAIVTGATVAAITYRLLRREPG